MENSNEAILQKPSVNYKVNFLILILGRIISITGSQVMTFALSVYVMEITNSPMAFTAVVSFGMLPAVLVNIFAGIFVDRHNRKRIIVLSDLITGIGELILLAFFIQNPKSLALILCLVIGLNLLQGFFGLALNASIPNIVSEDKVAKANSMFQSIGAVVGIIGPILGAIGFKAIGIKPLIIIDSASFLIEGILAVMLKFTQNTEKTKIESQKSYRENLKDIRKYLKKQEVISFFLTVAVILNFLYNPLMFVVLPYINYNIIKISAFQLSLLEAFIAFGTIAGAIFISIQKSNNNIMKKFFILLGIQCVLIMLWAFPQISVFANLSKWMITIVFIVLLFSYSMLNVIQNIPIFTYFQLKIPEEIRGRMFGVLGTALGLSTPVGMWIYGVLLKVFSWYYVTFVSGVIMLLLCLYFRNKKTYKNFIIQLNKEEDQKDTSQMIAADQTIKG